MSGNSHSPESGLVKTLETLFPSVPDASRNLGALGLLPFVAGALLCLFGGERLDAMGREWLLGYGAIILAFLGGVRWGGAILTDQAADLQTMSATVAGSVVAFVALLLGGKLGLLLLAIGFAAHYVYDRAAIRREQLPVWFGRLRLFLSTAVLVCLIIGLLFG